MEIFDNALLFNPVSCEWIPSSFSVEEGKITDTAQPGELTGGNIIDLHGARVIPGLIDAHVHIESSLLIPREFGKLVLSHGVTTVIADPHEIGNVAGCKGIDFMIEDAAESPADIFFMIPSCVPATPADVGGAVLTARDIAQYQQNPRVLGLGEMMNVPGVLFGDEEVRAKLALFRHVDGHAPCLRGRDLAKYVSAGIKSDHECISAEEASEKLRFGMYIFLREGDAARNVAALTKAVTPATVSRCCFATDDRHVDSLNKDGSIDNCIRVAVKAGMPLELALRAATLSAAECFGLSDRGILAPGKIADFAVLAKGETFTIERVYKNGVPSENVRFEMREAEFASPDLVCRIPAKEDLLLPEGNLRIIGFTEGEIVTESLTGTKDMEGTQKIVCVDRYRAEGFGVGLVHGLGLKKGALATSIAHDAHNIIATGVSDEEILAAVHAVANANGGMAVTVDGKTTVLPLEVGGLMSSHSSDEVCKMQDVLFSELEKTGAQKSAFMGLSFMSLTVIPHIKITPRGIFDGDAFCDVDIRVE